MAYDVFDVPMQDRLGKQQFFYNAFRALWYNHIDGDYAEFGCWSGSTFWLAHMESRKHGHEARLYAFDSFDGLPPPADARDEHPKWAPGGLRTTVEEFHGLCARDGVPRSVYEVVPGFYSETIDRMSPTDALTNIALAFIDCDMYSSTRSVLRFLTPRLKHGMIIAFDDYFCCSPTQPSGERRAMLEAFRGQERWELLPFLQFGWHGQAFMVEDRTLYR